MIQAITPIDGRYAGKTQELQAYFSEAALIKYRVHVELEYLKSLLPAIDQDTSVVSDIERINCNDSAAQKIKEIERTTNHDVKAVEYWIKDQLTALGHEASCEWVHFALTSQDINNTAFPLMIKSAWTEVLRPKILELHAALVSLVNEWQDIPMLSRTHGQAASPSRLGKEIQVFAERLERQLELIDRVPYSAKFGGATGNFNAHHVAYPEVDWVGFANEFVSGLGLERQQTTTQIEHYDDLAALMQGLSRVNTILLDFCRDVWTYVSRDYFKQKIKKGEVGSSTMPHKVNPIDFENAEGNLGLANAVALHLASKLPISRLQRDLTDSTVLRNIGLPFAYSLIAYKSALKGISKLLLNEQQLAVDLEDNWAVVTEGIQTILRREGVSGAYEKLKELSRVNARIGEEEIVQFIAGLDISDAIKDELRAITPHNYLGIKLTK